ncbi:class I SAM-dependent methyltransferase [Phenylobacterium sp.]|uniref:class I SAM-dependent methyltransferase n=1 Tax=Phenylobacterium sp. TaxID=1871053 RepID=UPI002C890E36|nr:methyltransferase domain-containing protein [Phenylobacterium sp.]HLZ74553.1 methyltransferase domain-containing protein [Phenylobacterium sp.]
MTRVTYDPGIFAAPDLEAAKRIIVTGSAGQGTEDRWRRETPYLAELLGEWLAIQPGMLVVDYGCGVGRLSKALIERFGCVVLGVDSSAEMRALAPAYVDHANFSVVSRRTFQGLIGGGLRAQAAFSVWVLQHCLRPAEDIGLIAQALPPGAPIAIVNTLRRVVPAVEARWADDGLDLRALLAERFALVRTGQLDAEVVGAATAAGSFWSAYTR